MVDSSRSFMTVLGRLVIASTLLATLVVLAGCSGAGTPMAQKEEGPKEQPAPTPTPSKPMPTLLGTWQRVSVDRDDDGNELNTETTTLTFTATHYFDRTVVSQGGVPFDDSDNAGTYTSTSETSLEKTFYIDDNDDGIAEEATIEKEYLFSGDSLFIHHWGSEHREENYNRFERVEDLPSSGAAGLQGTWRRLGYGTDDEHGPSRETFVLTFARSRFIESFVIGDSGTNDVRDRWHWQGGWSATEADTITKTFEIDDDDEGEVDTGSVDKKYVLAGDLLAVQCWTCDDPAIDFDLFTRVQDPTSAELIGSWQFEWDWDRDNEDESDDLFFTLTAEVAESITLVQEDRNRSGELLHVRTIEAAWEFDPAEWFVNLTIIRVTTVDGDEEPEVDDHPAQAPGTRRRIALAPSAMPDNVRVSYLWDEEQWDGDDVEGQWINRPNNPFGDYWMDWARQ